MAYLSNIELFHILWPLHQKVTVTFLLSKWKLFNICRPLDIINFKILIDPPDEAG